MGVLTWVGENLGVVADVATAVVLGLFGWLQWRISRNDGHRHREAERLAKERDEIKESQWLASQQERAKAREEAEAQDRYWRRDTQITTWGNDVIRAMARLEVSCLPLAADHAPDRSKFDELDAELSALVDMGRLFFPNVPAGEDPVGFRVAILDQVLRSCYVARHMAATDERDGRLMRHHVWQARRRFVSLLQDEIRQSLREITEQDVGESIPIDPRSWPRPTVKFKIPVSAG